MRCRQLPQQVLGQPPFDLAVGPTYRPAVAQGAPETAPLFGYARSVLQGCVAGCRGGVGRIGLTHVAIFRYTILSVGLIPGCLA